MKPSNAWLSPASTRFAPTGTNLVIASAAATSELKPGRLGSTILDKNDAEEREMGRKRAEAEKEFLKKHGLPKEIWPPDVMD